MVIGDQIQNQTHPLENERFFLESLLSKTTEDNVFNSFQVTFHKDVNILGIMPIVSFKDRKIIEILYSRENLTHFFRFDFFVVIVFSLRLSAVDTT